MGAHVEDLFSERRSNAEASSSVLAVDNEKIDRVGFEDVWKVLTYDMAAGGAENVADKEDVHSEDFTWDREDSKGAAVLVCLGWRRANVFN